MNRIKSFFTATLLATAIGIGSITAIPASSASAQSLLGVTPGDIQSSAAPVVEPGAYQLVVGGDTVSFTIS